MWLIWIRLALAAALMGILHNIQSSLSVSAIFAYTGWIR
uniref:Uncharacterized protein n=1 Tax=Siphoviridae sp. ct0qt9 TaxID=2825298 RepID=A0A8S5P0U8_9CAUD|nr:MAG TPA: hypothetical protein [Siphoviridae sp. ct0qt9]